MATSDLILGEIWIMMQTQEFFSTSSGRAPFLGGSMHSGFHCFFMSIVILFTIQHLAILIQYLAIIAKYRDFKWRKCYFNNLASYNMLCCCLTKIKLAAHCGSVFSRVPFVSWAAGWAPWSSLSLFSRRSRVSSKTTRTLFAWKSKGSGLPNWTLARAEAVIRQMSVVVSMKVFKTITLHEVL